MSFTRFLENHTITASEMNNNFYHCSQGDWLPMGGTDLNYTSGVYDLGSDTYKWDQVYLQNINISGDLKNTWNFLTSYEINAVNTYTARIEFTGLNGDIDQIYLLKGNFVVTSTGDWCQMRINGDSSSSYGFQRLLHYATTVDSGRNNNNSSFNLLYFSGETTTVMNNYFECLFYVKTGIYRMLMGSAIAGCTGKYAGRCTIIDNIWNNTNVTITSLVFDRSGGTNFNTGTSIKIYRKV